MNDYHVMSVNINQNRSRWKVLHYGPFHEKCSAPHKVHTPFEAPFYIIEEGYFV